jgi:hypothetical protein
MPDAFQKLSTSELKLIKDSSKRSNVALWIAIASLIVSISALIITILC